MLVLAWTVEENTEYVRLQFTGGKPEWEVGGRRWGHWAGLQAAWEPRGWADVKETAQAGRRQSPG